jgi:hypothetical protein
MPIRPKIGVPTEGTAPRISSIALANLVRDHRANNEWNAAIEFYLRGYEDLVERIGRLTRFAEYVRDNTRDGAASYSGLSLHSLACEALTPAGCREEKT